MTIAQQDYVRDIDRAFVEGKIVGHAEIAPAFERATSIAEGLVAEVETLCSQRDELLGALARIVEHLKGYESWGTVAMGAMVIAEDAIAHNKSRRTRRGMVPSVRVADQGVPVHEVTQREARDKAAQAGASGSPLFGGE